MASGTIKSLIPNKGFGFISSAGKSDIFFHSSAVVSGEFDSLQVGETVTFEEENDPRDPSRQRAKNVKVSATGVETS